MSADHPIGVGAGEREGMTHELKTWPEYYAAVRDGVKRFELRRADRDYRVGDRLCLREYDPRTDVYTDAKLYVRVTYVMHVMLDAEALKADASGDGDDDTGGMYALMSIDARGKDAAIDAFTSVANAIERLPVGSDRMRVLRSVIQLLVPPNMRGE